MKNLNKYLFGAAALVALTGCIDDKYDLSNIDTTSEFKLKDLVLPANLDPITLSDIITIKEGDQIKEVTINGNTFYAVQESGTFESDNITVNKFSAESSDMQPNRAVFESTGAAPAKPGRKAGTSRVYNLNDKVFEALEYSAGDVDPSVRSLTYLYFSAASGGDLALVITMNTQGLGATQTAYLENLHLVLPHGLQVTGVTADGYTFKSSDYVASTGVLSIGRVNLSNNQAKVTIYANAIDLAGYDEPLKYYEAEDVSKFDLNSEFSIESGCKFVIEGSDEDVASMPSSMEFEVTYNTSTLMADAVMGEIQYNLKGTGLEIEPINLENLPDFLADSETDLILANPQIYLNLDNPVGQFGLGYQSGLSIIAAREDADEQKYPLDRDITVAGKEGSFNFLLAPKPDDVKDVPPAYAAGLQRETYSRLGYILSGEGLPKMLDIELIDPMIPVQKTTSPFKLGVELPGMKGSYEFLAPLALMGESRIIYTKTEDGWWSEDLSDLTITSLQLTTIATSTIPLDAVLAVYPLDREGNRIQGLEIVPATLPAYAENAELTFTINGTITDLDGVFITATVRPEGDDEVLKPSQTIILKDLKAKISGNYTKKL